MKLRRSAKVVLALSVFAASMTQAALVEKPVVLKDAMLTATVSDLHGFIDEACTIGSKFHPMMNSMMLKSMGGMQIGDSGFRGVAPGTGGALVMLAPENMFVVLEVVPEKKDLYLAFVEEQVCVPAKYVDGVVVMGSDPDLLSEYVAMVPAVKKQLLSRRSATLRVACSPSLLTSQFAAEIQQGVQMMTMGMSAEMGDMSKVLEGEVRVLLSLASQCNAYELEISPSAGALRINETISAVPGSRLDAFLKAPVVNKPNPNLGCKMLGDGVVSFESFVANPSAMNTLIKGEAVAVLQAMGLDAGCLDAWLELMAALYENCGGMLCETIGFGGEDFPVDVRCVCEMKDGAAALGFVKSSCQADGVVAQFCKGLGVPVTMDYTENVGECKGVKLHRVSVDVSGEAGMAMEMMGIGNYELDLALVGNVLVGAPKDAMDQVVGAVQQGTKPHKIQARKVFPSGGDFYVDFDLAQLAKGAKSMVPPEMSSYLDVVEGADPISAACFSGGGAAKISIDIPESLISKIGAFVMQQQMPSM